MIKPTTNQLHSIADLIHKAVNRRAEQIEGFVTTREKQLDFMWHLYGQGFSAREIAEIYGVGTGRIEGILERFADKKLKKCGTQKS